MVVHISGTINTSRCQSHDIVALQFWGPHATPLPVDCAQLLNLVAPIQSATNLQIIDPLAFDWYLEILMLQSVYAL